LFNLPLLLINPQVIPSQRKMRHAPLMGQRGIIAPTAWLADVGTKPTKAPSTDVEWAKINLLTRLIPTKTNKTKTNVPT
jgi:hypothetical protein